MKNRSGHCGTVGGENGGKERLRIFECEGGASQKGLQECPMARVVEPVFSHLRCLVEDATLKVEALEAVWSTELGVV
jgi:hypothetical protein